MKINKPLFISVVALVLSSSVFAKPASAEITATASETLIIMREEEKVARDTYRELAAQWELGIFSNISKAEQKHMDAIEKLLEKYGIADPVTNDTTGIFANKDLRTIYEGLLERGFMSSTDALQVGAFVEEFDIRDLKQAIAESTEDDLIKVYENLERSSRNHLRAFVRQIESQGVVYQAQVLSVEEVDEIVNSDMERGHEDGQDDMNNHSGMSDNQDQNVNDDKDHQSKDNLDSNNLNVDEEHENEMKEDHDKDANAENDHEDEMKNTQEEREEKMKQAQEEHKKKMKDAQKKREEARKNARKQNKFNRENRRSSNQRYNKRG